MTDQAKSMDARVPSRDDCVLRYVLEKRAAQHPDKPFMRLPDGDAISYEAFRASVERAAAGLAALGVKQGDYVNVWLPNGVDMVRIWFAINWLRRGLCADQHRLSAAVCLPMSSLMAGPSS